MKTLPLEGITVADYSQYVAGPLCTLLLADLGADVIKVEPPQGDQWRRQEPCGDDVSKPFVALNRNKRSIALDLKSEEGRRLSAALVARADVVVHNCPPERARIFGLDPASVLAANPRVALVKVSAFGSDGPAAGRTAYDIIAQAASGLLMSDARVGDEVPIRAGGIAMADLSAGMLAAVAALAGLARARTTGQGGEIEVSLLGAGLAVQIQRFISLDDENGTTQLESAATRADLDEVAQEMALGLRVNPYYRAFAAADGFIAIACLNRAQRARLLAEFGLEDPAAENPDDLPRTAEETARRERIVNAIATGLAERPAAEWVERLRALGVPCEEVRTLGSLFRDPQVEANGLVQEISQPGMGAVSLLGNLFKLDGEPFHARRSAPIRGEHGDEILRELGRTATADVRG